MQKNHAPKSKAMPLVISIILFLGIGFVIYSLYQARVALLLSKQLEATALLTQANTQASKQAEIAQLEALLTADPCTLKLMFAKGAISSQGLAGVEQSQASKQASKQTSEAAQKSAQATPRATAQTTPTDPQAAQATQAASAIPAPDLTAPELPLASEGSLNQKIEQATVFIISVMGDDLYTGTGFFISPSLILTNKHVLLGEGQPKAAPAVVVTNKHLKTLQAAKIVAISTDPRQDYALLQLEQPASVQPLALKPKVERTTKVSAWGFPSAITVNDPNYRSLLSGNLAASPEVVYSDGVVSVVVDEKPQLILHTAPLSHGNSGGPLVDNEGNVLGINTLITLDDQTYRQTSMALAIADVLVFLQEHGVTPNIIKD